MDKEPRPPAPATQRINKESIRLLVIQHGQREAARIAGLNENTVRSWALRYHWSTPTAATKTQPNGHSPLVERVSDQLSEMSKETRTSLARTALKAAKQAERSDIKIKTAKDLRDLAGATQLIGPGWEGSGTETTINVLGYAAIRVEEKA